MKQTAYSFLFLLALLGQTACGGQGQRPAPTADERVGGPCETCELIDMGQPSQLLSTDTSAGWWDPGPRLQVSGTVYHRDGRTPAPGVILYYWQTDHRGRYSPAKGGDPRVVRHGRIRGWVRTDSLGRYAIFTNRPAPYPGDQIPAHVHLLVKEPGLKQAYYVDELVFDEDSLLTGAKRKAMENRGGSGILRGEWVEGVYIARKDLVLGLNIPGYPVAGGNRISGPEIGEEQPSFIPFHAWGPDEGSRACPVCKYGRGTGVLFFVGRQPNWPRIRTWIARLEQESRKRSPGFKAYFVYGNDQGYDPSVRKRELQDLGRLLDVRQVALCYLPSFNDPESEINLSGLDPDANLVLVYRNRVVVEKWSLDEQADAAIAGALDRVLDQDAGEPAGAKRH